MIIREGQPEDAYGCAEIDSSFFTTHVWQMEELRPDPFAGTNEEVAVIFREVRLPRPRSVTPRVETRQLVETLQNSDLFLVAEDDDKIQGYLGLSLDGSQKIGLITTVVVNPSRRQKGVGRRLVDKAKNWAERGRLWSLMLETQTKNYPAVRFFQKSGFSFCGYNDHYYPDGEIAIFFAYKLRRR